MKASSPVRRGWLAVAAVAGIVALIALVLALLNRYGVLPGAVPVREMSISHTRDIGASGEATLSSPIGLAADGPRVYVADAERREIVVLGEDGSLVGTFGAGVLRAPLYLAVSPLDGRVYVADRALRSVLVFSSSGALVTTLTPGPRFATGESSTGWQPVAVGFAPDGTLYVTDVSGGHRVLEFRPAGTVADSVRVDSSSTVDGVALAYANGVAATRELVVVADSNNARLLIGEREGARTRVVSTGGLPRGVAVIEAPGDDVFAVVDTMGGAVRVLDATGRELAGSATAGATRHRFPSGVAYDGRGTLYVADTGAGRITVWRVTAGPVAEGVFEPPGGWPVWLVAVGVSALVASAVLFVVRRRKRAGSAL